MMKAVVYLELATRAGEKRAAHVKNAVLHRLSSASRDHAMHLADSWRALPSVWAKSLSWFVKKKLHGLDQWECSQQRRPKHETRKAGRSC